MSTSKGDPARLHRRAFLKRSALVGGAAAAGLQGLVHRSAAARPARLASSPGYGPLVETRDAATGLPLLKLPRGFWYTSFGWTTDPLVGGAITPPLHDGMAVVREIGPYVLLVRNHEIEIDDVVEDGYAPIVAPEAITYDPKGTGGTTTLLFNRLTRKLEKSWISLGGTANNCAGGPTPWGSWMTCEEIVAGVDDGYSKPHGWVFEVPGFGVASAEPLVDMGRLEHEAVAIDPRTGIAYMTEDADTCGFYRFLDERLFDRRTGRCKPFPLGGFSGKGILQMLKVRRHPQKSLITGIPEGTKFHVEWVTIDDPTDAGDDGLGVFTQGLNKGGAIFSGLEGCWYGDGDVYFNSKNGGKPDADPPEGEGQVWRYRPASDRLELIFESPSQDVMDNPDNLTVSPRGGLLICEDGDLDGQRLLGLTPGGDLFPFATNNVDLTGNPQRGFDDSFVGEEWAGVTFSKDGKWLFANIQDPGITFAITGPWHRGEL